MRSLLIGQGRKNRMRAVLRRVAIAIGAISLCLLLIYTAFRRWTFFVPPHDEGTALSDQVKIESIDGATRMIAGESWMEWRDGLWRMQLTGDPRTMGHNHGLLAGAITADMEQHMARLMSRYLRSFWQKWLVENSIRWQFRQLPENIPPRRLVELAAFSRTMIDIAKFTEEPYQRMIYYHALHDMTQRLAGSPLIGCTAFAVWGRQTENKHLIVGRNFDFEGGRIFDKEKAVMLYRTPERIPFVSIAWPGMMGVVTGINAKQLYVSINAARTDDPLRPGIPMGFMIREVLERAGTIAEALAIIKQHKVMIAEAILLADGKNSEGAVVELSPQTMTVRRSPDGRLGLTNHFVEPKFKGDASNDWLKRYTTSDARYRRLEQLLKRFSGRIDVPTAAMILRNRTALDDEPLALGNRNAIDALIATHGVIADLTTMIIWVSKGPHLLGEFVPIDLKPLFALPLTSMEPPVPIPAESLLGSAEHKRYQLAQKQLDLARTFTRTQQLDRAMNYTRRAILILPESPDGYKLLGDLLWDQGRTQEAQQSYTTFLKLHPPYLKEIEEARMRLGR